MAKSVKTVTVTKPVTTVNNPNWPSTTGNLSGGGRGNNPPKK